MFFDIKYTFYLHNLKKYRNFAAKFVNKQGFMLNFIITSC